MARCRTNRIKCIVSVSVFATLLPLVLFAADPEEAAVPCVNQAKEKLILASSACRDVNDQIEKTLNEQIGHVLANYYEGKLLRFLDVEPWLCNAGTVERPVCDLSRGEVKQNYLGESCFVTSSDDDETAGLCVFDGVGIDPSTCKTEQSYIRGMTAALYSRHLWDVISETRSGKLKLVQFGGCRPCAEGALALSRVMNGEPAANGKPRKPGILAVETRLQDDLKALENVTLARGHAVALYSKLAMCEITKRVEKQSYELSVGAASVYLDLMNRVNIPCARYVLAKREEAKKAGADAKACDKKCEIKHFTDCYIGLTSRSIGFDREIRSFMDLRIPNAGAHPAPRKKLLSTPRTIPACETVNIAGGVR